MTKQKNSNFFYRILCGFFLGISIIAPGVSGSVIAVMMGIYRDLIAVVSNPFKNLKKNIIYLLPMGIGAVLAFGSGVLVLSWLFDTYPVQAKVLFMGLVAGGLPFMFKQAREAGQETGSGRRTRPGYFIGMVCAFLIAGSVGLVYRLGGGVSADTFSLWYLCIAGFVAGASSMMPGMSVSMILMLFGVYTHLMNIASDAFTDPFAAALIIAPVGIAFVLGMVVFSNITKRIFEKFTALAYFMVFGFMCGTLTAVFPDQAPASVTGWAACIILAVAGAGIAVLFQRLGKRFAVDEPVSE